jgi:hypothetical protein
MEELSGIFFNNGLQGIANVKEDGDFYVVSGLLQMIIVRGDKGDPVTTFQHLNPFVDESKIGVDAKIHKSAAFLYTVASDIKEAYYQSTRLVQPIGAEALIHLGGR